MDLSKETLAAFVDGELPPGEMEHIAALLAERPDLDAYVCRQEQLRANLKGAFTDILAEPVPERLLQTARAAPLSWRWQLRQWGLRISLRSLVPAGVALALGLVIGVVLRPAKDLAINASGQLVAQGALGEALDRKLASTGYDGNGPRIGISFRDKAGEACRTFSNSTASGVACRRNDAWVVGTLVETAPENPGASYRMAGSQMPDAVRGAVAAIMDGAPFDAAAERAARDRGWSGR